MGASTSWTEFVAGVRDPAAGPTRAAAGFAARHDVRRVLDAWGAHVPAERIRLVTVPPRGAPGDVLLARFARATDLPVDLFADDPPLRNAGLGAAEVEMIRRLNERLDGRIMLRQLRQVIGTGIRPRLAVPGSRRLTLPAEDASWVRERAEQLVAELATRGHDVHGDLRDLLPKPEETPPPARRRERRASSSRPRRPRSPRWRSPTAPCPAATARPSPAPRPTPVSGSGWSRPPGPRCSGCRRRRSTEPSRTRCSPGPYAATCRGRRVSPYRTPVRPSGPAGSLRAWSSARGRRRSSSTRR